jgi:hypothetical protein
LDTLITKKTVLPSIVLCLNSGTEIFIAQQM